MLFFWGGGVLFKAFFFYLVLFSFFFIRECWQYRCFFLFQRRYGKGHPCSNFRGKWMNQNHKTVCTEATLGAHNYAFIDVDTFP